MREITFIETDLTAISLKFSIPVKYQSTDVKPINIIKPERR